jgi:phosphate:Na+ symporter
MQVVAEQLRTEATELRTQIMAEVAAGRLDVPEGTRRLQSVRWLRRVTYHVWRVCAHVGPLHQTDSNAI